jgi:hypothetical protein
LLSFAKPSEEAEDRNLSGMKSLGRSKLWDERYVGYWLTVTKVCGEILLATATFPQKEFKARKC